MTGNNLGYQSEEGGADKGAMGGGLQYSSQDSLPDSPYSSQSLDVQPLSEQGTKNELVSVVFKSETRIVEINRIICRLNSFMASRVNWANYDWSEN